MGIIGVSTRAILHTTCLDAQNNVYISSARAAAGSHTPSEISLVHMVIP